MNEESQRQAFSLPNADAGDPTRIVKVNPASPSVFHMLPYIPTWLRRLPERRSRVRVEVRFTFSALALCLIIESSRFLFFVKYKIEIQYPILDAKNEASIFRSQLHI